MSHSPHPDQGFSRREFLKESLNTGARIALTTGVGGALGSLLPDPSHPQSTDVKHTVELPPAEEITPERFPSIVDAATAAAVVGAFADHVFYRGVNKEEALGIKSALDVGGMALARIAALHMTGNHEAQELADEELDEIEESMLLVPVLVGLSDLTSTEMKVNPEELFGSLFPSLQVESEKYANPQRPDLDAPKEFWESYLQKVNEDLVNKTAEVIAVSSVLAPVATTYASSSLANRMKEEVFRILFEQAYAQTVLRENIIPMPQIAEATDIEDRRLKPERVHEMAAAAADERFNGSWGFTHLITTLSANVHGAALLGDPPELFAAAMHRDKPGLLAKANVLGGVISEVNSLALTQIWLTKTMGAKEAAMWGPKFLGKQAETIQGGVDTFVNRKDVSFLDGHFSTDKMIEALRASSIADKDALIAELEKLPRAKFQLSFAKYLQKKVKTLSAFGSSAQSIDWTNLEGIDFKEITDAILTGNSPAGSVAVAKLMDFYKFLQGEQATKIAELMMAVQEGGNDPHQEAKVTPESSKGSEYSEDKVKAAEELIQALMDKNHLHGEEKEKAFLETIQNVSRSRSYNRAGILNLIGILNIQDDLKPETLKRQLQSVDRTTLRAALKTFVDVDFVTQKPEDAVPGLEGQTPSHAHENAVLSHSAQEVLGALGTQIPAVPALKRTVKLGLDGVVDLMVEDPDALVIIKSLFILATEVGISAFADNVAAYLYAEGGIMDQMKVRFGKDVFERYPDLEEMVVAISLKIAEVAGALSKYGNGPNFTQEKIELMKDETASNGYRLNRVNMPVKETVKNKFAWLTNAVTLALSGAAITKKVLDISKVEKEAA